MTDESKREVQQPSGAVPEGQQQPPGEHLEQAGATWQAFVVRATSIVTLVIKVIGIGMAGNEAFLVDPPRDPVVLGLAAFMMAGATGVDNLIGNLLGGGKK